MKCKNAFWMSLMCGITLACSPVLAQGAQQDAPPTPPNGTQPGARPSSPLPPLPRLDPDQRDAQRTIPGPYRLTYTVREMDGGKLVGTMHYAMVLDADTGRATLKMGTKVPIVTGEYKENNLVTRFDPVSYIDIGMNFQASLRQFANGLELRSHVIQSAVDSQQSLAKQPVIRQTDLESSVLLKENQSITIGTMDMLGSTHVLQIEVEVTKIP